MCLSLLLYLSQKINKVSVLHGMLHRSSVFFCYSFIIFSYGEEEKAYTMLFYDILWCSKILRNAGWRHSLTYTRTLHISLSSSWNSEALEIFFFFSRSERHVFLCLLYSRQHVIRKQVKKIIISHHMQTYLICMYLDTYYSLLYFVLLLASQNKEGKETHENTSQRNSVWERVCLHAIIYILTSLHSNTNHLASNVLLLHYTVHRKSELYIRDLVVFIAIWIFCFFHCPAHLNLKCSSDFDLRVL